MNVIETSRLGKRYRRSWALRDCTLGIPGGQVRLAGPARELIASHGAGLEEIALRHLRAGVPSSSRTEAADS